jgi:hypothetical protein
MSLPQKTYREVKNPQMTARFLADYMVASERAKRTIVREAKYRPTARVVQHDEAKRIISKYIRSGATDPAILLNQAQAIRDRLTDTDFERDLCDHNADYIERFASRYHNITLPKAELLAPGSAPVCNLNGLKVRVEIHFRLSRLTKTNKLKVGAGMLRYAKGKTLPSPIGEWQSAFLFGYLNMESTDGSEPEHKLCLTLDAYAGVCHMAPTDSVSRFHNMTAACATIAEGWPNIDPPPTAIL